MVCIYEQKAGLNTKNYIYTDILGSIRCITDSIGNVKQGLSYDVWGNRRNPATGTKYSSIPTNLMFYRGFTGHEHLDELGLINMNGRVYDPAIALFLSPDNYVQNATNSQNFNRYTYCLNNPLIYTDPNGELFVIDDWLIGLFKGIGTDEGAWKSANRHAKNSIKIWGGLFAADTDKSGWGWQIVSRLTWELQQTIFGFIGAHSLNMFNQVENVDIGFGATVISNEAMNGKGALTLGSYIFGPEGLRADYHDHLFAHEYGHVLQSRDFGIFYIPMIGIPSMTSYKWDEQNNKNLHDFRWFEVNASKRAADFFESRTLDFDRQSFETGQRSTYINPRTRRHNTSYHLTKGKFHWSDLIINFPGVNLFYLCIKY